MELIKSILLGIIQGLTEFLPVSSSGHLVLGEYLLGIDDSGTAFEVLVHFGTLVSVVIYFRRDIWELIHKSVIHFPYFLRYGFMGTGKSVDTTRLAHPYYAWFIILASVPAAVVALIFKDDLEAMFDDPHVALTCLAITGTGLLLSQLATERGTKLNTWNAILIGIAQAFAILPGISRSGSTIVTGMFLGLDREKVAKFSFLMSVPVIFGATILKVGELMDAQLTSDQMLNYGLATISATISGYIAIVWVMDFIRKGRFRHFGYYCLLISLIGFIFI